MPGPLPVLLLSGPPGAGKTSVARELVKTAKAAAIHIEGDAFWPFFAKDGPKPDTRQAQRRMITVVQAMVSAARPFARDGYETIVDFSIGPWFLPAVLPYLKTLPANLVVLCPPKDVCALRISQRDGTGYDRFDDFHNAFVKIKGLEKNTILAPADAVDIAARIRKSLRKGIYRIN